MQDIHQPASVAWLSHERYGYSEAAWPLVKDIMWLQEQAHIADDFGGPGGSFGAMPPAIAEVRLLDRLADLHALEPASFPDDPKALTPDGGLTLDAKRLRAVCRVVVSQIGHERFTPVYLDFGFVPGLARETYEGAFGTDDGVTLPAEFVPALAVPGPEAAIDGTVPFGVDPEPSPRTDNPEVDGQLDRQAHFLATDLLRGPAHLQDKFANIYHLTEWVAARALLRAYACIRRRVVIGHRTSEIVLDGFKQATAEEVSLHQQHFGAPLRWRLIDGEKKLVPVVNPYLTAIKVQTIPVAITIDGATTIAEFLGHTPAPHPDVVRRFLTTEYTVDVTDVATGETYRQTGVPLEISDPQSMLSLFYGEVPGAWAAVSELVEQYFTLVRAERPTGSPAEHTELPPSPRLQARRNHDGSFKPGWAAPFKREHNRIINTLRATRNVHKVARAFGCHHTLMTAYLHHAGVHDLLTTEAIPA